MPSEEETSALQEEVNALDAFSFLFIYFCLFTYVFVLQAMSESDFVPSEEETSALQEEVHALDAFSFLFIYFCLFTYVFVFALKQAMGRNVQRRRCVKRVINYSEEQHDDFFQYVRLNRLWSNAQRRGQASQRSRSGLTLSVILFLFFIWTMLNSFLYLNAQFFFYLRRESKDNSCPERPENHTV